MNSRLNSVLNLYCCMYSGCLSEYSTKFNLKRHIESVHLNIKKYFCTICTSNFSSKQSLKEHLRIHSGLMPFKCTACEKSFRQASQLSLHRRIHIVQGVDSDFIRLKVDEDIFEPANVQVSFEVDLEKFRLPEIHHEKVSLHRLPFPFF